LADAAVIPAFHPGGGDPSQGAPTLKKDPAPKKCIQDVYNVAIPWLSRKVGRRNPGTGLPPGSAAAPKQEEVQLFLHGSPSFYIL
jgi:hypothetical protein